MSASTVDVPTSSEDAASRTHAARAYDHLLDAITRCELAPGSWFNERDMAASLGMSRTPFRQALHRLALDGLVETVPKRAVFVTLLDVEDMLDSFVVRIGVQVEVLARATGDIDLDELDRLNRQMRKAQLAGDVAGAMGAYEQFHRTLLHGNRRAQEVVERAWTLCNRARFLINKTDEAGTREVYREHGTLLAALKAGDTEAAAEAMRAHLEASMRRLESLSRSLPDAFVTKTATQDADHSATAERREPACAR